MTYPIPSLQVIRTAFTKSLPATWASMLLVVVCILAAIPAKADAPGLQLAYQATFPNGSLQASVDHLRIGPMVTGDSQIPNSNPTFTQLPGELLIAITHPVGLPTNVVASAGVFATPVNFAPGSVLRVSATFRAPVGPLAVPGWAVGVSARTGGAGDLASETRLTAVLRTASGGVLRLNIPFGSTAPTFVVLPTAVRDEIFSAVAPKPFTLDLSIDRLTGMGQASLTVENNVFPLSFVLSDFKANGGPSITAVGASIANAGAPGQTVSVHVREFRIYTQ